MVKKTTSLIDYFHKFSLLDVRMSNYAMFHNDSLKAKRLQDTTLRVSSGEIVMEQDSMLFVPDPTKNLERGCGAVWGFRRLVSSRFSVFEF
jgi:hypothetical protein